MLHGLRILAAACVLAIAAPALAQTPAPTAPATQAPAKAAPAKAAPAAKPAAAPAAALLDINTASEAELQALKGVGDVRAKAIIAGRPYKGKDELWQKKILPKGVYAKIKDQIIAKQ
jgi:DNA uptake protein ComE-like DNA-binding protein